MLFEILFQGSSTLTPMRPIKEGQLKKGELIPDTLVLAHKFSYMLEDVKLLMDEHQDNK